MSAFRLVRQLRKEGFLDADDEILRLVRMEQLMRLWQAAYMRPVPELPLRWIIPAENTRQLAVALHSYAEDTNVKHKPAPRVCLGLFAAAEQLGFGFVHGVPPSFYLENLESEALVRLGLSPKGADHSPDVFVRMPICRESVFRGAVVWEGVPVADILQLYLDVSAHPSRGEAQAEDIRRRALNSVFKGEA